MGEQGQGYGAAPGLLSWAERAPVAMSVARAHCGIRKASLICILSYFPFPQ